MVIVQRPTVDLRCVFDEALDGGEHETGAGPRGDICLVSGWVVLDRAWRIGDLYPSRDVCGTMTCTYCGFCLQEMIPVFVDSGTYFCHGWPNCSFLSFLLVSENWGCFVV